MPFCFILFVVYLYLRLDAVVGLLLVWLIRLSAGCLLIDLWFVDLSWFRIFCCFGLLFRLDVCLGLVGVYFLVCLFCFSKCLFGCICVLCFFCLLWLCCFGCLLWLFVVGFVWFDCYCLLLCDWFFGFAYCDSFCLIYGSVVFCLGFSVVCLFLLLDLLDILCLVALDRCCDFGLLVWVA